MLLTLFFTVIILGAGYLGIVESGRRVLDSESTIEEVQYENTSSNVFYGKIEDDIELFPWNYYSQASSEGLEAMGYSRMPEFVTGNKDNSMEELLNIWDCYFMDWIAYESDTEPEIVWQWYENKQEHILENMEMTVESPVGEIYFYQDILELDGKKYQVKVACSDWNILNFTCAEYREDNLRDSHQWEEGKEKLVTVLEDFSEQWTKYFYYMMDMRYYYYYYDATGLEYVSANLESKYLLDNIIVQGMEPQEEEKETVEIKEKIAVEGSANEEMATVKRIEEEYNKSYSYVGNAAASDAEENAGYSYQVIELNDMILLLMQGDETLGIFYDPITQKFCGYNYFYTYVTGLYDSY